MNNIKYAEKRIQLLRLLIDKYENSEGLIVNTLDNTELTDTEKIKIIKDNF